jgi:prepilin-type N-terminal cleavage/methylation domain-containing protein
MSDRGFTLLEILLVAAVLGIMALAVIPSVQPYKEQRLDVAAREVAAAIRFARDEALRTGTRHGVIVNAGSQRLQVFWVDTSALPPRIFDVRDPLDKKLYDLQFATDPVLSGVKVTAASFYYRGRINPTDFVGFNKWGTPKYRDAGTIRLLRDGEIKLGSGDAERVIKIFPITGRVTVN